MLLWLKRELFLWTYLSQYMQKSSNDIDRQEAAASAYSMFMENLGIARLAKQHAWPVIQFCKSWKQR